MSVAMSTDQASSASTAITREATGTASCGRVTSATSRMAGVACGGALLATTALTMLGCSATPEIRVEYQTVEIPIPIHRRPPESLVRPYRPERLPVFIAPGDERSTSCLTPDGEKSMARILIELDARDRAWRAWADE